MKIDLRRKTKIVCTLGPGTASSRIMERLIRAGMNVARINMSHGDETTNEEYIRTVRTSAQKVGVPVAILIDLPGPRYRTGDLKDEQVILRKGARFVLTSRTAPGDQKEVSLNLGNLIQDVKKGDNILLDDGAIRLQVLESTETDILCKVIVGGILRPRRGIAAPGVKLSAPFITDDTKRHLRFAAKQQTEFIALSFVSRQSDVVQVRSLMAEMGFIAPIVSKVERREAVRNFDRILQVSDGIMVARGDLGVEMALEKVPLLQKQFIKKCNSAGKPVITATQMLESMIKAPRPTRAEVADVANAIYDGTDAIMLSAETAIGKYPVEAVSMMVRIAKEIESGLPYERRMAERGSDLEPQTDDAIAYDACHTAHQINAHAILAYTESGSTAWRVCKYRPRVPIVALTDNDIVRRRLVLAWGVYPYRMPQPSHIEDLFVDGNNIAFELGIAGNGDHVIITGGVPIGVVGTTNLLKVQSVKVPDTVVKKKSKSR